MKFSFKNDTFNIKIWNGENLGTDVVIDTETTIAPFHTTPELVTIQAYGGSEDVFYISLSKFNSFLEIHHDSNYIFHNAPFDMDVLGKSFLLNTHTLYDAERIYDTSVLYRLYHLSVAGFIPFKYNLNYISQKLIGVELDKAGEERTTFEQYLGKEPEEMGESHLIYGAKDVVATYYCYKELVQRIKRIDKHETLLSHNIQVKGELALLHIHKNGIGFDLKQRDEWISSMNHHLDILKIRLSNWGWYRGLKGNKDKFEDLCKNVFGLNLPYKYKGDIVEQRSNGKWYYMEGRDAGKEAPEGNLSTSREDLEIYETKCSFIKDYLKFIEIEKATTFVRDIQSSTVHPRYNSMVNTGRTSCSKPNFQQLPRMGDIRNMFKAQEGNTLIITDYSAIELATLSQVSYNKFGESVMGDKINDGADLHRYYASVLYSKDIANVTKDERQSAKAANFGFPGGLGIDTFIQFARGYDLTLSVEEAQRMKDTWFSAFPEMKKYMKDEVGYVYTLTGRKRGNTTYCAEKNTPFQGLAADGAKLALYNLDKAGFKVVGFVHDEIICEVPIQDAEKMVKEQEKIMIDSMKIVVPDVKIGVESNISERYCK